ncbi:hypothetical protein NDU88_002990 [Pleurodeles waltl]|uniref:Uncharacterized protein n=1 Tax=Pleurodeles waltl TaxID=8319 RepID=A0AAV7PBM5_PLEWA|nr:hypothetical protein NDU88_002990 [Pleurodeles waltl]
MDSTICTLATESKSISLDIAGFQAWVTVLDERMITMEDHLNTTPDHDQEALYLRRHIVWDHRPQDGATLPCPIIACLLHHRQARQLLSAARFHSPLRVEGYEVRIAADFSKETSDRCKAFLAL